jgi:hydroxymethylpyrimidine/phosphomethylpyrimidine kinase
MSPARIAIIAGSDSGGGAGIQADIKTVTALGGYAMTAVTALTAQNTLGVQGVEGVAPAFIRAQMESIFRDIGADAVKTGMLHSPAVIEVVAETLAREAADVPLIVDPVMVAQSGDRLVSDEAMVMLREVLIPRAQLITPNLPEAEALLGRPVDTEQAMAEAAEALRAFGCEAVLLKGGHLGGESLVDILAGPAGVLRFAHRRIDTRADHGTGCTLASAVAEGIGRGLVRPVAVDRGRRYLRRALETAVPMGGGHGPVNHAHTVNPFALSSTDDELS